MKMVCRKPFMVGGTVPVRCGQCLPCRIQRRRIWTWRCYLEGLLHDENSFVTLTYDELHLPNGGSLVPQHWTDFLKRFRERLRPNRVRFFACGEYGELFGRPHFHALFFGIGPWCGELVRSSWGMGNVQVGEFNEHTAGYVCGYVIKKLEDDLHGIHADKVAPFIRHSIGIGRGAVSVLAEQLRGMDFGEDVPMALRMGKRSVPLGRYLRAKLREELQFTDEQIGAIKQRFFSEKSQEVCSMLQAALADPSREASDPVSGRSLVVAQNAQACLNVETRSKIRQGKKL